MTTLADFATSLQSWELLSDGINGSNGELTVYHNVLAVPKVARVVENTCIDVHCVLPGFPLSPITAEVPQVAEAVRTIGLV